MYVTKLNVGRQFYIRAFCFADGKSPDAWYDHLVQSRTLMFSSREGVDFSLLIKFKLTLGFDRIKCENESLIWSPFAMLFTIHLPC